MDEVRTLGPIQTDDLVSPDTTTGCPNCGPFRSSSLTSALAFVHGDTRLRFYLLCSDGRSGLEAFSLREQCPCGTGGLVDDCHGNDPSRLALQERSDPSVRSAVGGWCPACDRGDRIGKWFASTPPHHANHSSSSANGFGPASLDPDTRVRADGVIPNSAA